MPSSSLRHHQGALDEAKTNQIFDTIMASTKQTGKRTSRKVARGAKQPKAQASTKKTSATAVLPIIDIYLEHNFLELETDSTESGYVEVTEIEDTNGAKARMFKIDCTVGQRIIIWHCRREFVIIPECSEFFELRGDAIVCLYRRDKKGTTVTYPWAGVRSSPDRSDKDYKYSLALLTADPPIEGPGKSPEVKYTVVAELPCHARPLKPKKLRTLANAVVRATIVLQT